MGRKPDKPLPKARLPDLHMPGGGKRLRRSLRSRLNFLTAMVEELMERVEKLEALQQQQGKQGENHPQQRERETAEVQ